MLRMLNFAADAAFSIDIQLRDSNPSVVVAGGLFEDGRDHFAGAAPFGPEIHQHGGI